MMEHLGYINTCMHCNQPVKLVGEQWHSDIPVLPQYCWIDPMGGSQLHDAIPWTREELERGRAM